MSIMNKSALKKLTGTAIPLGAIYTKESPAIGEFPSLKKFASFCKKAGLKIIQLLPVNDTGTQSSPYSGLSAFALHPIYISIPEIPEFEAACKADDELTKDYNSFVKFFQYKSRYDYQGILNMKISMLMKIYETTETAKTGIPDKELEGWIEKNSWIKNYAVYKNLKWKYMQASWKSWKKEDQTPGLAEIERRWNDSSMKKDHLFYAWVQFRAEQQFSEAAAAVKEQGIILKGDMPIMMNEDSCDAWALPEFFNHSLRAGSPVDGENPAGQNWGFPTYNWTNLKAAGYSWWKERLQCAGKFYGAYRLDHILGFFRIWAIPARDSTALLGHSEPGEVITRQELTDLGFDQGRIHWLSEPHIPTGEIDYFTWNHDNSVKILEKLCVRLPGEELWNFNRTITGDRDILEADLSEFCTKEAEMNIKKKLAEFWSNRTLIEIEPDVFVPLWTYKNTYPWSTLSDKEKSDMEKMFNEKNLAQDKKWESQAKDILGELTSCVDMVPCGEDLGVNLPCVPGVMKDNSILGLRVVRWSRQWEKEGQPYVPFGDYDRLSITTTSVHDAPAMRQWWNEDKAAAELFAKTYDEIFKEAGADSESGEFTENVAKAILNSAATSESVWCVHPLQDFLFMDKKYWMKDEKDERVNIPGEVTDFNWTYRMPADIESLEKNKELVKNIKAVAALHDKA